MIRQRRDGLRQDQDKHFKMKNRKTRQSQSQGKARRDEMKQGKTIQTQDKQRSHKTRHVVAFDVSALSYPSQ